MSWRSSITDTDHRPWPVPRRPWALRMTWRDLLFMHWPVPAAVVAPLIAPGLELERFAGSAWLGVVPFRMTGVRPRCVPALLAASFPEVNVRTYVRRDGIPGVWFFSLDAADRLAVWAARRFFHLPYHLAAMSASSTAGVVDYRSRRTATPDVAIAVRYQPSGAPFRSRKGSFDHWATERYCLFSADEHGRILRGDIHHRPWPLQPAEAEVELNTLAVPLRIPPPAEPPVLHFARRLDVLAWPLAGTPTG
jgi:uncharacterized protein YqjF (DUF2071 family)